MASDYRLDRDARSDAVRRIRAYFERERGEELGELAAGFVLDFVAEELGPLFYNAGLSDSQALIARFVDSLDADIEAQHRLPPLERARPGSRPTVGKAAPSNEASADRGVELHTERLLLRPFRAEDERQFAGFVADEAYLRYLSPEHPDLAAFVAHNVAVDWERQCSWVICLGDRLVGSVFLGTAADREVGELAYLLAPAYWGQGIATEAARAVLDHAFATRGLARVLARADEHNLASLRIMEKLGMTSEGVLRAHRVDRLGLRSNEAVYGILAFEWAALHGR